MFAFEPVFLCQFKLKAQKFCDYSNFQSIFSKVWQKRQFQASIFARHQQCYKFFLRSWTLSFLKARKNSRAYKTLKTILTCSFIFLDFLLCTVENATNEEASWKVAWCTEHYTRLNLGNIFYCAVSKKEPKVDY